MSNLHFWNFVFLYALVFALLSLLCASLCVRFHLTDKPSERKRHVGEIPLAGGPSLFFFLIIYSAVSGNIGIIFLVFLTLFFLVGLIDDKYNLNPSFRLLAQLIFTILFVVFMDVSIPIAVDSFLLGNLVQSNSFSFFITTVTFVVLINAINLADGLDGLVAIYIINSLLGITIVDEVFSIFTLNLAIREILILLLIFAFVFLILNLGLFEMPKIFLGDSGAYVIGFTMCYLVTLEEMKLVFGIIPWLFFIPIFDICAVIVLRIRANKSIFGSDRNHIHYRLLARLDSPRLVLIILGLVNLIMSGVGLGFLFLGGNDIALISFLLFLGIFVVAINKQQLPQ